MIGESPFSEEDETRAKKSGLDTPEAKKLAEMGVNKFHLKEAAEKIKKNPKLFELICNEFRKKVVGEEGTVRAIFLSACSIFVRNCNPLPLNALINSESSAGKSYVTKSIYDIFPSEQKEYRTKITPEVFTYWHNSAFEPTWSWDGKILFLEDIKADVLNSSTFKIMVSEGSAATVIIRQRAVDILINGKPCCLITTAEATPKLEVANRFNFVQLDESPEQTYAIHRFQARVATNGMADEYNPVYIETLRKLQRINVKIPYINKLVDYFPISDIRTRRSFPSFINFIKSSTAIHQFSRESNGDFFISNGYDYELARDALKKITMGSSVPLTHKQRKAYEYCKSMGEKDVEFTAPEIITQHPFASKKQWYAYLDHLLREKLLTARIDSSDGRREVRFFKVNQTPELKLPEWKKL